MFTGIVEALGRVHALSPSGSNLDITIETPLSSQLQIDQSVAHNGICLTVTSQNEHTYSVTAIEETLRKTNLGGLKINDWVNLERSLPFNGRIDGHLVQGHVDQTGVCMEIEDQQGSFIFTFNYDPSVGNYTVEKGSVCLNGVSLTVIRSLPGRFSVAVIPYTYEHTNLKYLRPGDLVNIEFDILGKYIKRCLELAGKL